jgi:hypothetical protein
MREHVHAEMGFYRSSGQRKYLNTAERRRFMKAAQRPAGGATVPPRVGIYRRAHFPGARAHGGGDRYQERHDQHPPLADGSAY